MTYSQIISALVPAMPKSVIGLASDYISAFRGVAVQVNNIVLIAYESDCGTYWLVDVLDSSDLESGPDVHDFKDAEDAMGFLFASYLKLTK